MDALELQLISTNEQAWEIFTDYFEDKMDLVKATSIILKGVEDGEISLVVNYTGETEEPASKLIGRLAMMALSEIIGKIANRKNV